MFQSRGQVQVRVENYKNSCTKLDLTDELRLFIYTNSEVQNHSITCTT